MCQERHQILLAIRKVRGSAQKSKMVTARCHPWFHVQWLCSLVWPVAVAHEATSLVPEDNTTLSQDPGAVTAM